METELTQKQIGERIAALRKTKGLTQENLAKTIQLSRPSLVQIELGRRGIDLLEFYRLSLALEFSLDDFISPNFLANKLAGATAVSKAELPEERISTPVLDLSKFKNILLYILERCAGKPNVGEPVLYKLLYFCDFNYYELYEEHLTGATYRKLPYGPLPQCFEKAINQMLEGKQIQRIKTKYYNKIQIRYIPLIKADLAGLKAIEKEVIDNVISQMGDWTTTTISEYSHKDLPWEVADDGKDISYELAFYRESPYSVRVYDEDQSAG